MILRVVWLLLAAAPLCLTFVAFAWFLSQSAFTRPFAERSAAELRLRLETMINQQVTADWLETETEAALAAEDVDRLNLLLDLANSRGHRLSDALLQQVATFEDARSGILARGVACGQCMADIQRCETVAQVATCAVPFELTPLGDLNAVRQEAVAYVGGDEVDRLNLGLGIIGLGATGAVLATGGTSYTLKATTSFLRMARRIGTLTPALTLRLTRLIGDAIRWERMGDFARFRIGPAAMVDSARLAELTGLGQDLTRVLRNTSTADALSLMRNVDGAEDAARLARVSDAMGEDTRPALAVLGKARVWRAAVRLTDLAIAGITALILLIGQVAILLGQQIGNRLLRAMRRRVGRAIRGAGP